MAANDPVFSVPTPTGTLQGCAAFSWDGAAWQPSAGAYSSVATPTGVLRGIAPFSWSGSAWTPTGRAMPGVATPTGTLDGVALYTWSGSAWTPVGGAPDVPTPTGTLQGVAGFQWDGSAWQPAGQAGPEVATPTGVLQGVALFNWSGSAWAAASAGPPGVTLDLNLLSAPLDPRITFTRASTATYFDATGTLQSTATNTPRFDTDPAALTPRGLLIEESRTNSVRNGNATGAVVGTPGTLPTFWISPTLAAGISRSVVATGTESGIPYIDVQFTGTSTATGNTVNFQPEGQVTVSATQVWTWSAYWRLIAGSVPANTAIAVYFNEAGGTSTFTNVAAPTGAGLATQRVVATQTMSTGTTSVGCSIYVYSNSGTVVNCTIRFGGAQLEQGAFPTSYIPTTSGAVTRSADSATMPTAAWFNAATGSLVGDCIPANNPASGVNPVLGELDDGTTNNLVEVRLANGSLGSGAIFVAGASAAAVQTANTYTIGSTTKVGTTYSASASSVCMNGGAVASAAPTGLPAGVNRLNIGNGRTAPLNGWLRRIRYWPRVLSNTELQQVTT